MPSTKINKIIKKIKQNLEQKIDPKYRDREKSFSKEDYQSYGVRTPDARQASKNYWKQVKRLPKKEVLKLCEQLLDSQMWEEQLIAFDWAFRLKSKLTPADYARFFTWLEKYVDTWFKCDDFCTHTFGYLIYKYPQLSNHLLDWVKSENRWVKRAAAVALIYSVRRQALFERALEVADELLLDEDDLVQKGYGWLLKEATKHYPSQVLDFVLQRKERMPRTALRYAIEKLSDEQKERAME